MTPELLPEVLADHLDRLYRAAWALCGSREDAEDLVQETYARVLAKTARDRLRRGRAPVPARRAAQHVPQLAAHARPPPGTVPLEDAEPRLAAPAAHRPQATWRPRGVRRDRGAARRLARRRRRGRRGRALLRRGRARRLGVPPGTIMSRPLPRPLAGRDGCGVAALERGGGGEGSYGGFIEGTAISCEPPFERGGVPQGGMIRVGRGGEAGRRRSRAGHRMRGDGEETSQLRLGGGG